METERNWTGNGASGEARDDQGQNARGLKQTAISKAQEAKEQMRSLADSGKEEVCKQIDGFAKALRSTSEQLRSEEEGAQVGYYTEFVGQQVERFSGYLRERDAAALVSEVENFARRQPLIFLGGCVAAGFAIGRFFKASPPMNDSLEFSPGGAQGGYQGGYEVGGSQSGSYSSAGYQSSSAQPSNYTRPNYDNYSTDTQFGAGFAPSEFAKTPAVRSSFGTMDSPSNIGSGGTTSGMTGGTTGLTGSTGVTGSKGATNTRSSVVTAPVEPVGTTYGSESTTRGTDDDEE